MECPRQITFSVRRLHGSPQLARAVPPLRLPMSLMPAPGSDVRPSHCPLFGSPLIPQCMQYTRARGESRGFSGALLRTLLGKKAKPSTWFPFSHATSLHE